MPSLTQGRFIDRMPHFECRVGFALSFIVYSGDAGLSYAQRSDLVELHDRSTSSIRA